jgi:hypothetical protein
LRFLPYQTAARDSGSAPERKPDHWQLRPHSQPTQFADTPLNFIEDTLVKETFETISVSTALVIRSAHSGEAFVHTLRMQDLLT